MGIGGAELSLSGGTRFERMRIGGLGSPSPGSVVAGRAGGGGGGVAPTGRARIDAPGDAVCARGGGGVGADGAASELDCGVAWCVSNADVSKDGRRHLRSY